MRHSFSILFTVGILMIIGVALIPGLDISNKPRPRQGKTLNISYNWPGASAKVVEQNVTSRIEGLVSSVRGVNKVSSVSNFGSGSVTIQLKENVSVSGVKFEIASMLRQVRDKLPKDVSYPELSGGEVVTGREKDRDTRFLSYMIKAAMPDADIKRLAERTVKQDIEKIEGVNRVEVSGGTERYMEISYNAEQMALYGLSSSDIEDAIRNFLGRQDVIGSIIRTDKHGTDERMSLFLTVEGEKSILESIPVKSIDGKIIYLNNLAKCEYKDRDPNTYFRINGLNTVYMNVMAESDANINNVASEVKDVVERSHKADPRMSYEITYDKADEQFSDFKTLVKRSAMSLLILLLFVFACKRDLRYLFIISASLLANILIAVICYRLLDIRLQPFSMAGITVSLGLIIDSTIVMVDHYSYHRNFNAYFGIIGATLTTVGALLAIFWLPDNIKNDLYDFSRIIIVNLVVAQLVSAVFTPALIDRMDYSSRQRGKPRNVRLVMLWNKFYGRYLKLSQNRMARPALLVVTACIFGWSLYLFVDTINSNVNPPEPEEMKLHIMGQMPVGGTATQLNEKVRTIEAFLSQFKEIKRYETNIEGWGAEITVEFKPENLNTSFPFILESKVIGKLITIGGADWSTWGVSQRGFSNSLNLQHRSSNIEIAGYEYDRLYRFAEDMCKRLKQNNRVQDITIETPEHEQQEDEYYMEYNKEMLANDSIGIPYIYRSLSTMLAEHEMGRKDGNDQKTDYVLRPDENGKFDVWQLENSFIKADRRDIRLSDLMSINKREAKNCIPRENQEYVLRVAFNVLGSYTYTNKYIKGITDEFNAKFPIGFRCVNKTYGGEEDNGKQYWLIGLVVVIIFFICAILFESLYKAVVIIMLIPVSLTGIFLTFHFSDIEFGTGGFAAMVLLCGLTVNNGIYMVNEYKNESRYIKAYNHKIIPIFLTVFSTILGFIPFLADGPTERFWFPFAVGSISGLLFSIISVVFTMPLFLKLPKPTGQSKPF
jgi:multidrug efflux pump subunit AcrB